MSTQLSLRENLIKSELDKFYSTDKHWDEFCQIIADRQVSLRLIDWFIGKYADERNLILYWVNDRWVDMFDKGKEVYRNAKYINVYSTYQNKLKSYSKKYFDIFKRKGGTRGVVFTYRGVETTYSQLIFCQWIIESHLITYIRDNISKLVSEYRKVSHEDGEVVQIKEKRESKSGTKVVAVIN